MVPETVAPVAGAVMDTVGLVVSGEDGVSVTMRIASRLKYSWSATMRRTCGPAASERPPTPSHWKVPHQPVLATATEPVTLTRSTSACQRLVVYWLLTWT